MSIDAGRRAGTLSDRIAAEIRAEMARQQISGRTLARKMGRSPNWVSLKTSGSQKLDVDDLVFIAEALGVAVIDLFPRADREVTLTNFSDDRTQASPPTAPAGGRPPGHPGMRRGLSAPGRTGRVLAAAVRN